MKGGLTFKLALRRETFGFRETSRPCARPAAQASGRGCKERFRLGSQAEMALVISLACTTPEIGMDASRLSQQRSQFLRLEPRLGGVNHAMAVGAYQSEIGKLRRGAVLQCVDGFGMVHFDKSAPPFAIACLEVEIANLADKAISPC